MKRLLFGSIVLLFLIAGVYGDSMIFDTNESSQPEIMLSSSIIPDGYQDWIVPARDRFVSHSLSQLISRSNPQDNGIYSSVPANQQVQWEKSLGGSDDEYAWWATDTIDGGSVVAGYTNSTDNDVTGNHGGYDYWVVKLTNTGNISWEQCYGGSANDGAFGIIEREEGGYVITGATGSDDGDVTANHGSYDYWVVNLSDSGEIIWEKSLGGSNHEESYSVLENSHEGYIVAGITNSTDGEVTKNHGDWDEWIVELSDTGEIVWEKCLGGSGTDVAQTIIQTSDGGYIVAGITNSIDGDVSGNHGGFDYWIVKLDSVGEIVWEKCYGGSMDDRAFGIAEIDASGYIIAGYTYSNDGDVTGNHGESDYWIVKISDSGDIEWQKCLGGSEPDVGYYVLSSTDGGYVIMGDTLSSDGDVTFNHGDWDEWVVKLNKSGEIEWESCFGGSGEEGSSAIVDKGEAGYLISGFSYSDDGDVTKNFGLSDYWVLQILKNPVPVASFQVDRPVEWHLFWYSSPIPLPGIQPHGTGILMMVLPPLPGIHLTSLSDPVVIISP